MRRPLLALLAVLVVLLAVNTVVMNRDTEPAKADAGRVIDLPGGDLQVREDGPRDAPNIVLRIVIMDGVGHSPHVEKPDETARLVRNFLDQQPAN